MKNKEQLDPEAGQTDKQGDENLIADTSAQPIENNPETPELPLAETVGEVIPEIQEDIQTFEVQPVEAELIEPQVEEVLPQAEEAAIVAVAETEPVEVVETVEVVEPGPEVNEVLTVAAVLDVADESDDVEGEEEEVEHEVAGEVAAGGENLASRYARMSREDLVQDLEALVKNEDINIIRAHIGFLKASFRKLLKEESLDYYEKSIAAPDEHSEPAPINELPADPLVQRFEDALNIYKNKKAVFDQALEKQKVENLEEKERILEELRHLIDSEEELKKTYDQFRDLQEKWRNIGPVPQNDKNNLWNNYHFLVEKFFDKIKINKELKDLDLRKNLELKTELCEKAEELLLEPSIIKSFQRLQKLHEAWKEAGPVPNDKKDEIWDRFKSATEKLNKRRQDYYENLRDDQQKNLSDKIALCEKAEQFAEMMADSPRQWQDRTNQINALFRQWKSIGFAPKKVNNEVWNRFRSALDLFFKNKKDYFLKFKENQSENYNQKLNLCLQAEALRDSTDWRRTTDELIALQKQWKEIGTVPSKFSDKIWKRFRAACDEFFKNKSEYFSNIGETQDENLQKKREIIRLISSHPYTSDNVENLRIINEYQRQWMETGHVPIKQKDKIQADYRNTIDEQFEKLGISKKAKSTMSFRTKIENIKNTPNADHIIYKERTFIINKISTLQNDIKVLENNIGFFASSKKADILKTEVEEKIEKAKQEITLLEQKLKILRES